MALSPEEWEQVFPTLPERLAEPKKLSEPAVPLFTAVFLPEQWNGIASLEYPVGEKILFRSGRWCVMSTGIECLGVQYYVDGTLLDEEWIAQLAEKTWLYDPSDMVAAFAEGRKIFRPAESEHQRQAIIHKQIQTALERATIVFKAPTVFSRYVYLPSRMRKDERQAFCEFLSKEGFVPGI